MTPTEKARRRRKGHQIAEPGQVVACRFRVAGQSEMRLVPGRVVERFRREALVRCWLDCQRFRDGGRYGIVAVPLEHILAPTDDDVAALAMREMGCTPPRIRRTPTIETAKEA